MDLCPGELGRLLHDTVKLTYKPHRVIRSVYGSNGSYFLE
mgnify:CR=1 FL=1